MSKPNILILMTVHGRLRPRYSESGMSENKTLAGKGSHKRLDRQRE
ncbi:MAG: hypothetical protein HN919_02360 [Verrucomicrobia bacterium]|nr:hypothetical protein [Verrucomicrobiota bacterium]